MTTYVQPVMRRRNQRFAKVSAEYIGRQNEEITDRARIDIGKCGGRCSNGEIEKCLCFRLEM